MLQGKEFTDDDDGTRRVITDVVFSHEDDVYYAKYIIKGGKDIKKNHDYTMRAILLLEQKISSAFFLDFT